MTAHHTGAEWQKVRSIALPIIRATLPAPCIEQRCQRGGIVHPGQRWQVGHIVSASTAKRMGWTRAQIDHLSNLGPSHGRCNASEGGKLGSQVTAAKRAPRREASRRMPSW